MRRMLRLLLALGASWLFCLAFGALVEGPEQLSEPPAPMLPVAAAITAPESAVQPEPHDVSALRRMETAEAARRAETALPDAACVRVADRNGYPMGTATYVRTVYQAFPPERLPG